MTVIFYIISKVESLFYQLLTFLHSRFQEYLLFHSRLMNFNCSGGCIFAKMDELFCEKGLSPREIHNDMTDILVCSFLSSDSKLASEF